jgi:carbamate kinase
VAALGGNALLRRGEPFDIARQRHNAAAAARAIAPLALDHEFVITHGNGPQIGFLAHAAAAVNPAQQDLDALGAESGGLVGYLLEQALTNELPACAFATLLTQTIVDPHDRAFSEPVKPVGPLLAPREAERLEAEFGWRFVRAGSERRRVVASPRPLEILQLRAIEVLLDAKIIPICVGGGGVPVFLTRNGGCGAPKPSWTRIWPRRCSRRRSARTSFCF